MSFESFFVARVAGGSIEISCRHDSPKEDGQGAACKQEPWHLLLSAGSPACGAKNVHGCRREHEQNLALIPCPFAIHEAACTLSLVLEQ